MRFTHPWWLLSGLLAGIVLLWLWRVADARRRAALARFVAAHLRDELTQSISVVRRRAQRGLFLAAVALLCAALAGPQWGYRWVEISRRGNEIVFAIDTSRSMSTPDIKPSRLARAKLAIDDFANQLDGDAVGIVAFAGSAFLVCPITLDYGAFHESLSAIDTNTIPRGGTNISSAIQEAQAALRRRPGSDKILVLVTDGEDLEGSALAAAQKAKQQDGLTIFTVGVGTAGGDLIPVPPDHGGGFVKDETGAALAGSERRGRRDIVDVEQRQLQARRAGIEGHRRRHGRILRPARHAGRGPRNHLHERARSHGETRSRLTAAEDLHRTVSVAAGRILRVAAGQFVDRHAAARRGARP